MDPDPDVSDDAAIDAAVRCLRAAGASFAFVHGSRADGTAREHADIDIAAWFGSSEVDVIGLGWSGLGATSWRPGDVVDAERLARLLRSVTDDLARLRRFAEEPDDVLADEVVLDHVKYRFVTAIEGCIDAARGPSGGVRQRAPGPPVTPTAGSARSDRGVRGLSADVDDVRLRGLR